jgi:hypothetical protein
MSLVVALFGALLPSPASANTGASAGSTDKPAADPALRPLVPSARAAMAESTYMFSWAAFSYVTARQSQTDSPLQARAGTASTWEQFYIYYSGDSWVIKSTYNAKFVSARLSQTDAPLQARADTVGAWEKFDLWLTGDGATVIQSRANGKYVTARASQTDAPLQARAAVIDDWEKFTIPL